LVVVAVRRYRSCSLPIIYYLVEKKKIEKKNVPGARDASRLEPLLLLPPSLLLLLLRLLLLLLRLLLLLLLLWLLLLLLWLLLLPPSLLLLLLSPLLVVMAVLRSPVVNSLLVICKKR